MAGFLGSIAVLSARATALRTAGVKGRLSCPSSSSPYTIIKEVNPDNAKGSAVGVINFITFGVTAAVAPVFSHLNGRSLASNGDHLAHFKEAAGFWIVAIIVAIGLALFLRETGTQASRQKSQ